MPFSGREVLSSRLTLALQLLPMLVWLVVVYFLLWVVLHQILGAHTMGGGRFEGLLSRLVIVLLAIPFVALPVIAIWASNLRRVVAEGEHLLVGLGYGRTATVPLSEVADISEWRGPDLRTVRLTFASRTRAGKAVRFLAPTRYTVPRDEAHPVVQALRETVAAHRAGAPAAP
jgi:hypothetical protein